jgi:hypothetical protein
MPDKALPASPFACGGYDIGDERLASHREVMIHSSDGPVPRLGDPFTIMRDKALLDLVVLAVLRTGLDWTARCQVVRTA